MHDYRTFCGHYGLDPETDEAWRDYREYRDALAALKALAGYTPGRG